jgi:FlaA1/EpsC-like NDP-sugar epimerase
MVNLPLEIQERLLGRQVQDLLTPADRVAFGGQRLLITGAGGSLGSELARQLASCAPGHLTLVDHSEYALFNIEREIRHAHPRLGLTAAVGDVSRRTDMRAICRAARPQAVYHAAAYKHVSIVERSIVPSIRTNALGALDTALAAREVGARFVLISSDKAAEPKSVMGATKRLAELATLGLASTRFRPVAVRFGNILGSSGSLVEVMARCVMEGRNIPVTDPDATRFFMTAEEAVALVLKADLMGGRATTFWLDMGAPLRIGDLVERFIECVTPAGKPRVGIDVIGMRPGEKMREELTTQALAMGSTAHPRIWAARDSLADATMPEAIRKIRKAVGEGDAVASLVALELAVEDFSASDAAWTAANTPDMFDVDDHMGQVA